VKALLFLTIIATFGIIFFKYSRDKNLNKLLVSLATFGFIITLAVIGNLTRPVIPIFAAHLLLTFVAWGGLMVYVFKHKYYGWLIALPLLTIGLFLGLEFIAGSGHELT